MVIVNILVLVAASLWIAAVLMATRHRLRSGGIVSPPLFDLTMMFALGMALLLVLRASPLHLLWWFPLSMVLGVLLMVVPAWVNFNMACLGLLAGLKPLQEPSTKR